MNTAQNSLLAWTNISKFIFRFLFSYFILFILLLFIGKFIETPLRWFSSNILKWSADFSIESTGSGDRTFDYIRFIVNLLISLVLLIVWSIFETKNTSYQKLLYWFECTLRLFLSMAMLFYGLAKVFKGQFADPNLELLVQPVGEMSPMGLAWTFMGHSMAYNIFLGGLEILGGCFLLYRRTTLLGSMLVFGIMMHISFMNLTYDIPVKLFSIHLVAMSIILLFIHRKRIIGFFFTNETIRKEYYTTHVHNSMLVKGSKFIKKTIIIMVTLAIIIQCFITFKATEQLRSKSALRGIWETELFIKDLDTIPALLTDRNRWRYLIIDFKKEAIVKKMTDTIERYSFKEDTNKREINFSNSSRSVDQKFSYSLDSPERLALNNAHTQIILKKVPTTKFRLLNRKFHWINESIYKY